MINWIRLYFRRNNVSFSLVDCGRCKSPANANILHRKHYHITTSFDINRLTSRITHLYQSDAEWKHVTIPDLISSLTEASLARSVNEVKVTLDPEVLQMLSQLCNSLPQLSNDELLGFMNSLLIMKSKDQQTLRKNEIIKNIIDRLDKECLVRSSKMDLENVLPILEKFSSLTNKYSAFIREVLRRYCKSIHNKSADTLIRFVNVMNKNLYWQNTSIYCKPYEIEHYLKQNFHKLEIDQMITLICALIQANKSIVNFELKKKLFLYVVQNFTTMNDRHLNQFLNLFCVKQSFIMNMLSLTPEFLYLLDAFDQKFDTFSLDNVALIGMLSTKFLTYKPHFLDKLCRRFLTEGGNAKRSTIDNVVYTLMFFNYRSKDEDVYSKILQIITAYSLNNSYKHTRRYFRLISWFCNAGVYDYNTINEILDEEFLKKTYSKLTRFCVYPYPLVIDLSVEIECPDYAGKRLSTKLREDLLRCYDWDLVLKATCNGKSLNDCGTNQYQVTDDMEQYDCKKSRDLPYCDILREISSKLNTLFDKEVTRVGYVLPHMPRPNLFFCLDESGKLQDLAYLKDNSIVDYKALDSKYDWFAVTVLIRNTFLPNTTDVVPWGMEIVKWRQLQKLNINVIAVVQDEWKNMSEEQKIKVCADLVRIES